MKFEVSNYVIMDIKDFDEALILSMFGEDVSRSTFITIGKK